MSDLPEIDDLWKDPEEKSRWKSVMLPFLLLGFLEGAGLYGLIEDPESLLTPRKKKVLTSKSLKYAAATIRTTKEKLARQIEISLAKGESVKQLAKRIDKLFGSEMGYRSLRIARTQLTETINEGTIEALKSEGNKYKQWSTVIDGRQRPAHDAAHGQIVPIDEPFIVGGEELMKPGDGNGSSSNIINCRCTTVAPGTNPRQARAMAKLFLRTHSSLERGYVINLRRAFRAQRDRITSRLPS